MKFEPLNNKVLVKLDNVELVTKGGIHLVQDNNDIVQGTVEDAGTSEKVKTGDVVNFPKYAAQFSVEDNKNQKFVLVKDEDLLAKIV